MTHEVVPYGMTRDCHMEPWEKYTWHESHVVWKVPPKACVHVTRGTGSHGDTWHMINGPCEDTWP